MTMFNVYIWQKVALFYFSIKYAYKKSEWQYLCLERNEISPALSVNKGCHRHQPAACPQAAGEP